MFYFENRCVHSEQRSFALGIQWIVVRIFGTIPAPMIFGSLIDDSCILWQESCNEAGACLVYDNSSLSRYDTNSETLKFPVKITYLFFQMLFLQIHALSGINGQTMFYDFLFWSMVELYTTETHPEK